MMRTRVLRGAAAVAALATVAGQVGAAGGRTPTAVHKAASKSPAARCQGKALGISLTQASPGVSHHGYVIEFRNRGSACTITGYPGVDALNAKGRRILSAKRTKSGYLGGVRSGPIPKVHLAKGKIASAMVEWIDLGSPCPSAHSLKITAPNAVRSVVRSPKSLKSQTLCHVQVHPVVPGTTGQKR
jgi:Protein of unknown function (DUF4232)